MSTNISRHAKGLVGRMGAGLVASFMVGALAATPPRPRREHSATTSVRRVTARTMGTSTGAVPGLNKIPWAAGPAVATSRSTAGG